MKVKQNSNSFQQWLFLSRSLLQNNVNGKKLVIGYLAFSCTTSAMYCSYWNIANDVQESYRVNTADTVCAGIFGAIGGFIIGPISPLAFPIYSLAIRKGLQMKNEK